VCGVRSVACAAACRVGVGGRCEPASDVTSRCEVGTRYQKERRLAQQNLRGKEAMPVFNEVQCKKIQCDSVCGGC